MIAEAAQALRAGRTSSAALVAASSRAADDVDQDLGVYLARFDEDAARTAALRDEELARGRDRGPLHGIPVAIKDNIAASEGPTTAQSTVLDPAWAAGRDATTTARLKEAGAVVMGKTTLHELAIGHPDPQRRFPEARNPWDPGRFTGGSSSGSAVAVAAGLVPAALGTDTGGSLRIPAALCGVTSLMPTYGRVPTSGCVPLSYSIDRIGPIARTARDAAIVLEAIAGADPSDPSASPADVDRYLDVLGGTLDGVRIGVERAHHFPDRCDPAVEPAFAVAVDVLRVLGATITEVEVPLWDEAVAAHSVIEGSESLAYHRNDLQERWSEFTPWSRMAFSRGALVSGADYVQAQRVRRVVQRALAGVFADVDLIVMPTLGVGAVPVDELYADESSLLALFEFMYTRYWNCVSNPVLSVPMGVTGEGMPLGLQLAARPFDEALLLRAGDAFQRHTAWHELRAPHPLPRPEHQQEGIA